jgi:DNA polymerase-3 subunit gamma/tau
LRVSPYGHLPLELALVEALLAPAPPAAAAQPARPAPAKPARPAAPKPAPKPAASEKTRPAAKEPATTKPSPAPAAPAEPAAPPAEPEKPTTAEPTAPPAAKAEEVEPAAEPTARTEEAPPAPVTPPPQDGPPADAEPHETAQAVSGELSLFERVEEVWPNVVRDVRPHNNRLQAMLRDVYPVDVEGNTVVLLAKYAFHKNQIERPKSRQIIENVLSTYLGSAVAVACILHQEERTVDTRSLIKTVRNDPRVKAARNIFGAEIIDVVETEEPTTHE